MTELEVARLQARMDIVEERQKEIYEDVRAIRTAIDEARGGGKVAIWLVAAGAGAAASALTWIMQHIKVSG